MSNDYLAIGEDQCEWLCPQCQLLELPSANCDSISESSNESLHFNTSQHFNTSINHLNWYLYNARSTVNKLSDLPVLLQVDKPDIVAITETFLNEDISVSEIVDNSYYVFRRDCNRHGDDVMLLVKDTITAIEGPIWKMIVNSCGLRFHTRRVRAFRCLLQPNCFWHRLSLLSP